MRPDEIVDTVKHALEGNLPDRVTFATHELDSAGEDADITLPIVEIQPISTIYIQDFNTDFVDFKEDEAGNQIGRIYHSEYEMDVQVDVWTAAQSMDDPDEIGGQIRQTLYQYESAGPAQTLEKPDGSDATEIWKFSFDEGGREDDLTMSPSIRRWRQDLEIWAYEEFDTTADYIAEVVYPDPNDVI